MQKYILAIFALLSALNGFSPALLAQSNASSLARQVQDIFEVAMKGICESLDPQSILYPPTPEIFEIAAKNQDDPESPYRLYSFPCTAGAYNFGSVFYVANSFDEIRQMQFSVPELNITNQTDDYQSRVTGIELTGFYAYDILINPGFDPATNTLQSFSKWRGLADASSSGQWVFRRGRFVLKSYDVDASYDGEMNPVRIYGEASPSNQ